MQRVVKTRPGRCIALLALSGAAAALSLACVRAHADERILDAGTELLSYARATQLDGARTLIVNGLAVHVLSGSTRDSVSALLDTFHARCQRTSGGLDRLPRELPGQRRRPRIAERALDPVLRHDDARGGYVACLDLGAASLPPRDLVERIRRFLANGDVSEVGDVRFAWAFGTETGTHYVAVYTEGPMPLAKIFPTRGDAPGSDVLGVPRPARARRVLSAFQRDASPMVASYESELAPEAALALFRGQLARHGSSVESTTTTASAASDGAPHLPHLLVGRDRSVLAFASPATNGKTLLTIVRLQ